MLITVQTVDVQKITMEMAMLAANLVRNFDFQKISK